MVPVPHPLRRQAGGQTSGLYQLLALVALLSAGGVVLALTLPAAATVLTLGGAFLLLSVVATVIVAGLGSSRKGASTSQHPTDPSYH